MEIARLGPEHNNDVAVRMNEYQARLLADLCGSVGGEIPDQLFRMPLSWGARMELRQNTSDVLWRKITALFDTEDWEDGRSRQRKMEDLDRAQRVRFNANTAEAFD